jgi:hypothetical protein
MWGRSMVFVDQSTVNVDKARTGPSGPELGRVWAGLGRAGPVMCQTGRWPRGTYGSPLGLAHVYGSRLSARRRSMDRKHGPRWTASTLPPPCLVHGALGALMVYRRGSCSSWFIGDEASWWRLVARRCSFTLLGSFCTYAGMVESQRRLLGSRQGEKRLYDGTAAPTVSQWRSVCVTSTWQGGYGLLGSPHD